MVGIRALRRKLFVAGRQADRQANRSLRTWPLCSCLLLSAGSSIEEFPEHGTPEVTKVRRIILINLVGILVFVRLRR